MGKQTGRTIHSYFDTARFWADVTQVIEARDTNWYQVSLEIGMTCLAQQSARRDNPRIDTLCAVAVWANLSLDRYLRVFGPDGKPIRYKAAPQPIGRPRKVDRRRGTRKPAYDLSRFYADLDQVRESRQISWHQVWREAPGSAVPLQLSTFIVQRLALSENACRALAEWAELDFAAYQDQEGASDARS